VRARSEALPRRDREGAQGRLHARLPHQIGPEQQQFLDFAERELLPALGTRDEPRGKPSAGARRPSHDERPHAARAASTER
jgi:hypothetical protein